MEDKILELLLDMQKDIKTLNQRVEKLENTIEKEFESINKKLDRNSQEHRAMFELLESDVNRVEQENFNNWKAIAQIQSTLNKNKVV